MTKSNYFFLTIILLSVFLSFWELGENDLSEWDESEYGVNAFEMVHNGDYINYYYGDKPDSWNAKPPLSIWLTVLSYKIFGYNAFALRFFSALSAVLFFIFSFKLVRLYSDDKTAFIVCLILLSCKAILGFHIGRTGDMDALLLFFLIVSVYFFLRCYDFASRYSIIYSAIFLGLAFYVKGTASFVLLRGLFIYILIKGNVKKLIKDKIFLLAFGITMVIISSWLIIALKYGHSYNHGTAFYKSHNVLETLFVHDTFNRLTDSQFDQGNHASHLFLFGALDARFNLWNYFFYLTILIGLFNIRRLNRSYKEFQKNNSLLILSICLITPLFLLLTFSQTQHNWYLAPIFLFIAFIITTGIKYIDARYNWFRYVWISILLFNLGRQFITFNSPDHRVRDFFLSNKTLLDSSASMKLLQMPPQNYFLYLKWSNKKITTWEDTINSRKQLVFFNSDVIDKESSKNIYAMSCLENNCFGEMIQDAH